MQDEPPLDPRLSDTGLASALLQTAPVGVAVVDTRLRFCSVNAQLAAMDGLPAAQHIGRRLDEVLPPALAAQAGDVIQSVLVSGTPVQDLAMPGGTAAEPRQEHDWLFSYHPVWGEGPELIGVLLTARDLSAERAAQAAREHREDLARRVLDSLFAFVGVLDLDGTLREINRAPLEVAGLRRQDVIGRKYWDVAWWRHDPALPARLRDFHARALQGESIRIELSGCTSAGTLIPLDFMIAPLRDRQGRITHLVSSATDISDRKRSEEALRASAVMFRSVVESAPNGLAMVDERGIIKLLNSKMEDLFGYERGELLGSPIDVLVPAELRERHVAHREHYQGTPSAREMGGQRELYARRKDGSQFPVEIGLMPVNTPEGRQTIAAIVDVSEYKQAQRALEQALRQKTALLHEVHHRVKNNLQVISSLLSLQSRHASPEARDALADSQSRVKAMALTHQLLYEREDFSHVHMGVYLHRLVQLLRQGHGGRHRDIEVVVDIGTEELPLDLQRALPCALLVTELVTNAFKHAFPGRRQGRLTVSLRRDGEHDALIEVADDGIGIPPSIEVGKTQSLGFQLLPMLADQIGARLELHRDHGSRFTIRMPLQVPAPPPLHDDGDMEGGR
ncbi:PAS domain S-box protein [Caldimonas tepidiphila]|uniref:PAS domain S-box protein n=1 Tax=Caldimonas tepidiphila TaxID=2315841 RepID=UPI000E5AE1ED|nr:PAS domain S-box protein [Caldimonas tepidiphila]